MGSGSSTNAIAPSLVPPELFTVSAGPFNHAAGNGATALGSNNSFNLGIHFDRQTDIDTVTGTVETKASAARTIQIGYALDGQTVAAAVATDNQWLTSVQDLNAAGVVNGTTFTIAIDRNQNLLPANSRLFLFNSTTADTALVGLVLTFRKRAGLEY